MILLNFFIGIFTIFISPQIFIYYRFQNIKYSLVLIYSFLLSFTGIWLITLLTYYLKIPNLLIYLLAITITISSIVYMYNHQNNPNHRQYNFLIWGLSIILLIPLFNHAGSGFTEWDAVVSWNRWGIELYNNEYTPIHAAYPLLIPSLFSIIYKIQSTNDIWWTAKIALFYLPLITLVIAFSLYKDYQNKTFLFITIFIYPYLLMHSTIAGTVDMPVMIMGMLTLIVMYAAEINKETKEFEYYVYASLLLAGIASITKQSGLAFILFDFIYILLNLKYFQNKRRLILFAILAVSYFITFLSIYYLNAFTGVTGNIELLKSLSAHNFANKEILWNKFFSYPPNIPLFKPIENLLHIPPVMPYMMGLGFIMFILKDTRKYTSVSVLSVIFLIAGFFAWGKYASYHPRNSWWAHTFLIMFVSINFHHFVEWYKKKKLPSTLFYIPAILLSTIYFMTLNDTFAYKQQQLFQKKLGSEAMTKELVKIINTHKQCLNIYTNDFMLLYNYYSQDIQDHIISGEIDSTFLHKSVENTCEDGSYIVFRGSTLTYPIWRKEIAKLRKDKKILPYKNNAYIFYIPPYSTLSKDYFEDKTAIVNKQLSVADNKINYNIEFMHNMHTYHRIYGWAFLKNMPQSRSEKYIVLESKDKRYIIATEKVLRKDIANTFKNKNLITSGFKAYIFKKDLKNGDYRISILLIEKNKKQHLIKTNRSIIINETRKKDNHNEH